MRECTIEGRVVVDLGAIKAGQVSSFGRHLDPICIKGGLLEGESLQDRLTSDTRAKDKVAAQNASDPVLGEAKQTRQGTCSGSYGMAFGLRTSKWLPPGQYRGYSNCFKCHTADP